MCRDKYIKAMDLNFLKYFIKKNGINMKYIDDISIFYDNYLLSACHNPDIEIVKYFAENKLIDIN